MNEKTRPSISILKVGEEYNTKRIPELERHLSAVRGIMEVDYNYTLDKLTVRYDSDLVTLDVIKGAVREHVRENGDCRAPARREDH